VADANTKYDALDKQMTQAATTADILLCIVEVKGLKADLGRSLSTMKRSSAVLKACIRKFEGKDTKGTP
jgi:hypothetical protein